MKLLLYTSSIFIGTMSNVVLVFTSINSVINIEREKRRIIIEKEDMYQK
jgi:hypothetical protein